MTREYPPEVYGGAGVHVTELVAQLRHLCEVDVHCMGAPRDGAFVAPARPGAQGRQPGAGDAVGRPGDGQRRRHRDRGALAHLVHRAGRAPGRAAVRHPACADRALARADAAVEGRTARRRLPHLVVGGAHRGRGGRRRDRRQLRYARRRAAAPTRRWTPTGCTWCATGSTPTSGIPCDGDRGRRVGARRTRRRPRAGRSSRSSAGSPGRRASRTSSRRPTGSPPRCSWCCARAPRTPRRSPPR